MQATKSIPTALRSEASTVHDDLPSMGHWLSPDRACPVANVLTIDVEDWPMAVLGPHHLVSERVLENTKRCLQILRWHSVKATFFVLTKVANVFPDLVRQIQEDGHEIATHGHGHELLTTLTPAQFTDDVRRSMDILTKLTGRPPIGYRAPAFSIVESTRWAGPILSDLGIKYSSSVFPIRHPRYGIANAPRHVHRWQDCRLIECPPATIRVLGRNLSVAGGGYFRLLPGAVVRHAIRRLNRAGMPAILYMHPYELDIDGISFHKDCGVRVSPWRHLTQTAFRARIEARLHRLLETFQFTSVQDALCHAI
ncbi:MAG: DUF3473 domain-containing protein [Planctomycetota bacterium]|nr:DUF3473 domain-containing protein [Planctomycetota bacterium]